MPGEGLPSSDEDHAKNEALSSDEASPKASETEDSISILDMLSNAIALNQYADKVERELYYRHHPLPPLIEEEKKKKAVSPASGAATEEAASRKRKAESRAQACELVKSMRLDDVIEKLADAGYGSVDAADYFARLVTRRAREVVLRKVIECIANTDPKTEFQVFTEEGDPLHEPAEASEANVPHLIKRLRSCDGCGVLSFECPTTKRKGWVQFSWGVDPSEVIESHCGADWLAKAIKPAREFATKLEGAGMQYGSRFAWRYVAIDEYGHALPPA